MTGVTTNNDDVLVRWVGVLYFGDKARSADDIESCDTKEFLWVVDTLALEDFGSDGNGAVYGVGDDKDAGVWAGVCCCFGEITDDGGVGVEEVCMQELNGAYQPSKI